MKINLDDPNLTAFALGELSGAEQAAMEQAVASSPEAQEFVAETQQLSRLSEIGVCGRAAAQLAAGTFA